MLTLPVSKISQVASGALLHNNDCGPTCIAMKGQAYKILLDKTVDQVYDEIKPLGDTGICGWQLDYYLSQHGLETDWKSFTLHDVFDCMVSQKPITALIHYGVLVDAGLTEFKTFRGGHFVEIVGIDLGYICIHDPDRRDEIAQDIPIDVFMRSWKSATLDENESYTGLVPKLPICDLSSPTPGAVDYIVNQGCINVRSAPVEVPSTIVGRMWRGEIAHVVSKSGGYAKMTNNLYVWFNFLKLK